MSEGAIKRGFLKILMGPLVKWVMARMLSAGWIYPEEVKDIQGRMKEFGRQMVDAQADLEKEGAASKQARRDRIRKSAYEKKKTKTQGKTTSAKGKRGFWSRIGFGKSKRHNSLEKQG